jgi:hypothetical protein
MTNVIKTIFKDEGGKGTRNRPDFVALPDSSVGFYARASYDESHDEDGVEHLVIIDLKTTGWHSPTTTDTFDRYDVPIGGITWHVKDGCFRKSSSARQSSW